MGQIGQYTSCFMMAGENFRQQPFSKKWCLKLLSILGQERKKFNQIGEACSIKQPLVWCLDVCFTLKSTVASLLAVRGKVNEVYEEGKGKGKVSRTCAWRVKLTIFQEQNKCILNLLKGWQVLKGALGFVAMILVKAIFDGPSDGKNICLSGFCLQVS